MILLDWQKIYQKKHAKGGLGSGAGILQKNAFPASLVRPQAGETSHKKQLSCERARESLSPVSISKKSKPALPIQKSGQIPPT